MHPADLILDTSGLFCPQPLLRTKQALTQLQPGQVIQVVSTDPSSGVDFRVFSETTPHQILRTDKINGKYLYWIRKGRY
jgi:tRNA 2-thiouridine synthesizing protein A